MKGISEDAKDFVTQLFVIDPELRLTAPDALQHKWFLDDRATVTQASQMMKINAIEGGNNRRGSPFSKMKEMIMEKGKWMFERVD